MSCDSDIHSDMKRASAMLYNATKEVMESTVWTFSFKIISRRSFNPLHFAMSATVLPVPECYCVKTGESPGSNYCE